MASKFQETIAFHNHAIIHAIIKLQKLVAKHQKIKFITKSKVHKIYIFFLQNLSAHVQKGTSKRVDIIQTIVIKNNACQKEKFK
jgi:hypothetical protein